MKIKDQFQEMSPTQRRQFLKLMGFALGAPAIPAAVKYAFNDIVGGSKYAEAQAAAEGTLFLEFNYRDQVDLMHMFVPPSLATHQNLNRGVDGETVSLFAMPDEIQAVGTAGHYLTNESMELAPHVDNIAIIDTGEAGIGGVHGHEAGNGIRSPGRLMDSGASGKNPMWLNDGAHAAGSEELYTTTPTPASLHNYYQKTLDAGLKNGFAFKGISRFKHSVYHYSAGLPGGDLDRLPSKDTLFQSFPAVAEDASVLPTPEQADLLVQILKTVDDRYLQRRFAAQAGVGHLLELDETRKLLHVANPRIVDVPLTAEEETLWSSDIPNQQCTRGDTEFFDCSLDPDSVMNSDSDGFVKAQIWEQFGYATKILKAGTTRSIALEFDFMDLHGDGVRTEEVLRIQAAQASMPLARAITQLKDAGVWNRTLIALYTLDGSRRPAANSYGDKGKGTMILAGGMIKGGYYGDISVTPTVVDNGHEYAFHLPDPATGAPLPGVTDWGNPAMRTPSADLWLTVMKALGIPDDVSRQFPDTMNGTPYTWMLNA